MSDDKGSYFIMYIYMYKVNIATEIKWIIKESIIATCNQVLKIREKKGFCKMMRLRHHKTKSIIKFEMVIKENRVEEGLQPMGEIQLYLRA